MKIKKKQYLKHKLIYDILSIKNKLLDENRFNIERINLNEKTPDEKNKKSTITKNLEKTPDEKDISLSSYIEDEQNINSKKLNKIKDRALICTACDLCYKRKNVVFGEGNPNSDIMFIGEAPGEEEDNQGRPFVGKAGKLLTLMIQSIGFDRKDVYIANIIKCRPPENRNPHENEIRTCTPYLRRQIELINPKIIVTLGNFSSKYLLQTKNGITSIRGKIFSSSKNTIIPTFHPSYLLRNPIEKVKVWKDLQLIRRTIDNMNTKSL